MTGQTPDKAGHDADTSAFEGFVKHLQDALAHLYDPTFRPPRSLWEGVGCEPKGLKAMQAALVRGIEGLKPTSQVPPHARSRRIYGLLSGLYVKGFTQEQTAEQLGITARHLRRERPEAVRALALRLWEQGQDAQADAPAPDKPGVVAEPEGQLASDRSPAWRSQMRKELASLAECAPGAVADVQAEIEGTIKLARPLTGPLGITTQVGLVQPNLAVETHPTVLRQTLIAAIRELAQHIQSGEITIDAVRSERKAQIAVCGRPAARSGTPDHTLVQEMVSLQEGTLKTVREGDRISFCIELPAVSQTVLVVDDNKDIAHLYRRYAIGTSYHIVHTAQGTNVPEMVETTQPDVIVLDVMLPDADGWELLSHLREHPATWAVPILICSVVMEEELALALGADLYLTKPVERQPFIAALDRLLRPA